MVDVYQFEYFDGAVGELAILVDQFVNVEISDVGLCIVGTDC
jgi:hypothetical protein